MVVLKWNGGGGLSVPREGHITFRCSLKDFFPLYRVSRKTLYAFHLAISWPVMHRSFGFWAFLNSPFRQLFKTVQDFKYLAIFDQLIKEILT